MIHMREYKFSEIMDGFYDGPHATPEPSEDGPIFLGIKNIFENGGIDFADIRHISETEFPKWTKRVVPQQNDIVFSYEATLHRYALIPEGFRGCLGRRMALIRVNKSLVNVKYLYHYLLSPHWKAFVETVKILGATVDRISISEFPNYKISLPPLPIQTKIASILSAYDELIENNKQRIKLLEEMAEEIYKEWFVRFRFPGYESTKFFNEQGKEVPHGTVGALPERWEKVEVQNAFEIVGGGTPSTTINNYWDNGNINWFSPTDVTGSETIFLSKSAHQITELGLMKSAAKIFPVKSVMMTSRATIAAVGINLTEACTNQGFITCIPNKHFSNMYVYEWIKASKTLIENNSSGATFKEISRSVFKKMIIVKPNLYISKMYVDLVEPMFEEIKVLSQKNQLLQQTRDLLLPRLISGKLSVEHLVEQEELEPMAMAAEPLTRYGK